MVAEAKQVYKIRCVHCGKVIPIQAYPTDVLAWQNGAYIQDTMKYLSAADREMFISQTCNDCWNDIFGDEDFEE